MCCIQFIDLSTDTGGTITSYFYDFGDGAIGTQMEPQHCYVLPGTYIVTLLVTDNMGNVDTVIHTIYITHLDSIGCNCFSGIHDFSKGLAETALSPNPFHSISQLEIKNSKAAFQNCEFKIYNTIGALVKTLPLSFRGENREAEINRYGLNDGLYFYMVTTADSDLIGSGKFLVE